MFGAVFCVATAVLGIDVGWEPNAEGNAQYIIQIEPEMAKRMLDGRPIEFDLRPEHQGVRHFRFQVGKDPLPRAGIVVLTPPARPVETTVKEPGPIERPALPTFDQAVGPPDASADSAPRILPHESKLWPIGEQKAAFNQPVHTQNQAPGSGSPAEEALLVPLIIASGTTAGLLTAFLYLCWIHLGTRRSYRTLLADYHSAVGSLPGCGPTNTPDLLSLRG